MIRRFPRGAAQELNKNMGADPSREASRFISIMGLETCIDVCLTSFEYLTSCIFGQYDVKRATRFLGYVSERVPPGYDWLGGVWAWRVMMPKKISTMFSHDAVVGVKRRWARGSFSSKSRTSACLCLP